MVKSPQKQTEPVTLDRNDTDPIVIDLDTEREREISAETTRRNENPLEQEQVSELVLAYEKEIVHLTAITSTPPFPLPDVFFSIFLCLLHRHEVFLFLRRWRLESSHHLPRPLGPVLRRRSRRMHHGMRDFSMISLLEDGYQ